MLKAIEALRSSVNISLLKCKSLLSAVYLGKLLQSILIYDVIMHYTYILYPEYTPATSANLEINCVPRSPHL